MTPILRGRGGGAIAALTALGLFLMQFTVPLIEVDPRPPYAADVNLFVWDVPLVAAVLIAAPTLVREARRGRLGPGAALWALVIALIAVAFAVHPSPAGAQIVIRGIVALGLALAIAQLRGDGARDLVLGALIAASATQLAVGLLQLAKGAPLGLAALGELSDPLVGRHETFAPRGTLPHPYVLTAMTLITLALVAARAVRTSRPLPLVATLALVAVPTGITFSRAALAGLTAGVAWLAPAAIARRGTHALAVAAICAGAGLPALALADGWSARVDQTLFTDQAPTGADRRSVLALGVETVAVAPLTGVGPGRYLDALADRTGLRDTASDLRPHDVPLLVAAEAGVPAGVLLVMLLAAAGWRSVRSGGMAMLLYLVFVPYLLVDQFPYTHPQGLVLLGLWLGSLAEATALVPKPHGEGTFTPAAMPRATPG